MAYLLLVLAMALGLWVHGIRVSDQICDLVNAVRAEVDSRVSEINAAIRAERKHLRSRLVGDRALIAEGVAETRATLRSLRGARADSVELIECQNPSFFK